MFDCSCVCTYTSVGLTRRPKLSVHQNAKLLSKDHPLKTRETWGFLIIIDLHYILPYLRWHRKSSEGNQKRNVRWKWERYSRDLPGAVQCCRGRPKSPAARTLAAGGVRVHLAAPRVIARLSTPTWGAATEEEQTFSQPFVCRQGRSVETRYSWETLIIGSESATSQGGERPRPRSRRMPRHQGSRSRGADPPTEAETCVCASQVCASACCSQAAGAALRARCTPSCHSWPGWPDFELELEAAVTGSQRRLHTVFRVTHWRDTWHAAYVLSHPVSRPGSRGTCVLAESAGKFTFYHDTDTDTEYVLMIMRNRMKHHYL